MSLKYPDEQADFGIKILLGGIRYNGTPYVHVKKSKSAWVGGEGTVEATSRDMLRIRVTAGWEATVARDLDMDQGSLEVDGDLVGVQ